MHRTTWGLLHGGWWGCCSVAAGGGGDDKAVREREIAAQWAQLAVISDNVAYYTSLDQRDALQRNFGGLALGEARTYIIHFRARANARGN